MSRERLAGLLVFALALAFRWAYVAQIADEPAVRYPLLDAQAYHEWAVALVDGTWEGGVFYQDPLYPTFLSLLYRIFGPGSLGILLAQAVVDAASAVLVYATALRLFGFAPAVLAGALAALYVLFAYYAAFLLKAPLLLLLFNLHFHLLVRASDSDRVAPWAVAGIALGLAALTRANALLFVPLLLLWIALDRPRPAAARAARAAAVCAGIALALVPVALRNFAVGGELVVVNSQGGQNFYIGNFRGNDTGAYRAPPFLRADPDYEEEDFARVAEEEVGHALSPGAVSSYWWRRGLEEIRADPAHFVRHVGKKLLLLSNHHEIADNYSFAFTAERVPFLRGPWPSWALLFPFAICGAVFAGGNRRAWLLLAFFAGYAASLVVFFHLSRLRLPLAPLLILFAAYGAVRLAGWARERRWPALAATVAAIALAYPVVYADLVVDRIEIRHHNLAERHLAEGLAHQRRAAALAERGETDAARTTLERSRDEIRLAEASYRRGLEIAPRDARLNDGLRRLSIIRITNLHRLDRPEEAAALALELVRSYPQYPNGHAWLGSLLARLGRDDEARAAADRALELDPDNERAKRTRLFLMRRNREP